MTPPPRENRRWWVVPLALFALLCLLNPRCSVAEVGQEDGSVLRTSSYSLGPFGWRAESRIDASGDQVKIDVHTD